MAVIWQKQCNGKHYEVRSAGHSRRLYTDGVFHSQFNPRRSLTGNVWDLLSLPSFFLAEKQIRHVLVLGVGGGAVISQLRQWFPKIHITGVELDPVHIYVAQRFFDLQHPNTTLIEANAIEWVRQYRGVTFDLIIEDLFSEHAGEPVRVAAATPDWIRQLSYLLTARGSLVMNFVCARELKSSAFFKDKPTQAKYRRIYRFSTPLYENNIGVFLRQDVSLNDWRKRIQQHALQKEFDTYRHKYQIRKLAG